MSDPYKGYVTKEYRSQHTNPIELSAGERVRLGREDTEFPGWRWCESSDGRAGWVPIELLLVEGGEAKVLDRYSARELSVNAGEEVVVEDARHQWLLIRNTKGQRGWIPESHVVPL